MSDVSPSLRGRLDHAEVTDNPKVWQPKFISRSCYMSVWVTCGLCPTPSPCESGRRRPRPLGSRITWNRVLVFAAASSQRAGGPVQNLHTAPRSVHVTSADVSLTATLMSIVVSATPPRGGFPPKAKLENLIKELLMLAVFSFQLQRRFNSRHIRYHKWIQPATDTVRRVSKHERNHVIISAVTVAGTVSVRTDCSSRRGRTQLTANPCS